MIDVGVTVTTKAHRIDRKTLQKAAQLALKALGNAEVSIAVIGDRRMRALNRDALGHDYITDVLSFDHGDSPEGRVIELIICAPFAARQAEQRGIPFIQELARYVVHGCLHCAGYDDGTSKLRAAMWNEQERVLGALFGKAYKAASY